jgi:hypothetical protein
MTIYEGFDLFEYSEEVVVFNTWEDASAGDVVADSFIEETDIPQ